MEKRHVCPNCGSTEIRFSRRRFAFRQLYRLVGIYSFRCEDCQHLFRRRIFRFRLMAFAKCPTCRRMDLSRWNPEQYNSGFWARLLLAFGAKPVRCEYCRNNFCSFRAVRERFSKERRAKRSQVVIPTASQSLSGQDLNLVHESPQPDVIDQS